MSTATIINQDYQGPTINPNGEALARLTRQFSKVRGPADLRKALKAWGLTDEISPRQAAFWNGMKSGERRTVCRLAETRHDYTTREWAAIPQAERARIWQAIGDVATWCDRLKGRF